MAEGYVANWGSDLNDGLSWATAKKSLQGAIDANLSPIEGRGYFEENVDINSRLTDAKGMYFSNPLFDKHLIIGHNSPNPLFFNIHAENIYGNFVGLVNSYLRNIKVNKYVYTGGYFDTVISNLLSNFPLTYAYSNRLTLFNNNSFEIKFARVNILNAVINNIFANIDKLSFYYDISEPKGIKYCLFNNVSFKFAAGNTGNDETTWAYPSGTTDSQKLQDLKNRMATVYGGNASDYLVGCKYYSGSYNDIFIDADNGNFFLKNTPNNPALHMSYDGKYIGARPPAAGTFAIADATKTNIDANGNIVDQSIDANASFNTISDIGRIVEITNLEALANIAYRNGLSINTSFYVGADINAGANVLTNGKQYQVLDTADTGGTIVLDDAGTTIMNAFDTFTAIDEGAGAGLGFSSVDGLTVREIDISKYDERIEVTSSQTDASLATATPIKLLLHEPPLVNVDGSGEPTYGNADDLFDVGTAVPWKARYVKINVAIKAAQLYAR